VLLFLHYNSANLQLPRFCASFYNQADPQSLCNPTFDSDHIRGGTVLQQLTASLDQTTPVYKCLQAYGLAQSDPAAAARTGDNYRVRI
jgi:hypothetical protein